MMRWWWFGPSQERAELEREMRAMKAGGIGGFEVQPVYPLEVDSNHPYLSQQFLDNLKFTAEKAKELGLRFDLTLGSGWPFGGPHISKGNASGRLRVTKTEPTLAEGESLVATVPAADGSKLWFVASHTRQMVKRPGVGGEGWVLDHYSRPALDSHLKAVGEKLFAALGKTIPLAVFSDSLEVYNGEWTPNLLAEFKKRRGYDLATHLRALTGEPGEENASVRHDWGKTLSELADENYLRPLHEWARQKGVKLRSQTYGIPPVTVSSNALVDLPEGEGTEWRHASSTRWASSGAHLYGKAATSSETWTWLNSPVFRATPLDMKAEADLHFIQGVTQLIGHGWPYSPPSAGEPGWRFYAAAVFNDHNPWYVAMPDVASYLQKMSWLMRQGQPVIDVALYVPTADAFAGFTAGGRISVNQSLDRLLGPTVIPQILDNGYNFDLIDDEAIAKLGVKYKVLLLPGVERMPLATLEKVMKSGVPVIATRRVPSLAPGLMDQEKETPRIRELAKGLKLVADESKLGEALKAVVAPDLASSAGIAFAHRKLTDGDVYFVVNTTNRPLRTTVKARSGHIEDNWNPITGYRDASQAVELAPYESRVLLYAARGVARDSSAPTFTPIDLTGGWKVTFPDGAIEMPTLRSWSAEESRRFYSGTATYERSVNVPPVRARVFLNFGEGTPVERQGQRAGAGMRAMLDGPVRDAAVVYVNGQRAGAVWCSPYELDVTKHLRDGENTIRVVVGNSALNVMAKGPLPDYKALTAKYGERFQAQDMQSVVPQPSGLLGPVKLVAR